MIIVKIAAVTAGLLIVLLAGFLAWMGFFSRTEISERTAGPIVFIYEPFTGPYSKTQPVFNRVQENMKKEGLSIDQGIGIYYDNPSQTAPEKCRSECGIIIPESALNRAGELSKKYKIKRIEKGTFLSAEFPYKNFLSFMLGPVKVYPAFSEEIQRRGYAGSFSIEIYDKTKDHVLFLMPIGK